MGFSRVKKVIYYILITTTMELSTETFAYDVQFVETKKTKEIRIISKTEIKTVKTITWFETTSEITENLVIGPETLNFKEISLNTLPSNPSYLNLSNTKSINSVEIINKYVVDNSISFRIPEQITNVFYDIKLNEDLSL